MVGVAGKTEMHPGQADESDRRPLAMMSARL